MNAVIGLDFGTDSVRALIVDSETGRELGSQVEYYPRWQKGLYCNASKNQWRQHPLDYMESMEAAVKAVIKQAGPEIARSIVGVGVDTTGSTPVAVDPEGTPLSLLPGFEDNPNAMFILWKDHTAVQEAAAINRLCSDWETDYTKFEGGIYSSEWFWAKILRICREDEAVRKASWSWVEHCDWIPHLLTGGRDATLIKRSRCAAGHKALWHPSWGGLPPQSFLTALDPVLGGLRDRLFTETHTSDEAVGHLSGEWATRLGLRTDVVVAVGAFDAHMGAVGGQIEPYHLSKVMGTSTCDILVAPNEENEMLVKGICGQVDGSVIPGMLGLEAGQSAFGDIYAWFRAVLAYPIHEIIGSSGLLDETTRGKLIRESFDRIIPELTKAAQKVPIGSGGILSLDWMNGRRTPDANQYLKGVISGLNLGSDAPSIFRSLVESTCYGARLIVDRFRAEGIPIKGLIGLGGVAKKSPFIMQVMADVMNMPIKIAASEQTCALGAAMFAAVAAGAQPDLASAMRNMGSGFDAEYLPVPEHARLYEKYYREYCSLAGHMESHVMNEIHQNP
ncbi:MAG TPA: ribulokinase [Saprospiraceae bacterium]|nr:ribulokinase [Saprospiraceae bacterium]HNT20864.1 ribulokinase [Saprospiraceae bacterium]